MQPSPAVAASRFSSRFDLSWTRTHSMGCPFLLDSNASFQERVREMVRTSGMKPEAWWNATEFNSGDGYHHSRTSGMKPEPTT